MYDPWTGTKGVGGGDGHRGIKGKKSGTTVIA